MKTTIKKNSGYKLSNWSSYNQALVNRGSLTIWLGDDLSETWYYSDHQLPGGRVVYSDWAIESCLTLRALFGLGYRQTQGFIRSLFVMAHIELPVPCYSQLQRRSGCLEVNIKVRPNTKQRLDVVLDSTGLKVYGEGEWKRHKHGKDKN